MSALEHPHDKLIRLELDCKRTLVSRANAELTVSQLHSLKRLEQGTRKHFRKYRAVLRMRRIDGRHCRLIRLFIKLKRALRKWRARIVLG